MASTIDVALTALITSLWHTTSSTLGRLTVAVAPFSVRVISTSCGCPSIRTMTPAPSQAWAAPVQATEIVAARASAPQEAPSLVIQELLYRLCDSDSERRGRKKPPHSQVQCQ